MAPIRYSFLARRATLPTRRADLCASILLLTSACTAPIEAESLPTEEPAPTQVLRYRSVPDAPDLRPPLQSLGLLATSPDHPRWAVSDRRRLWTADGDGPLIERPRDFQTRLEAMAVDHEGSVWLVDVHGGLARMTGEGKVEELSPPVERVEMLAIGAKRVVVLGPLRKGVELPPSEPGEVELDERLVLAITKDGGHHWRLRRRPTDLSEFDDLRIAPDGTMQLMDGDERSCGGGGQARWTSHVDRPGWTELEWPLDAPLDRHAGSGGWSYGLEDGSFRAVRRDGTDHVLLAVKTGYMFAHDGRAGMLLADDGMWSVTGRKATRIGDLAFVLRGTLINAMAITQDGAVLVTTGKLIFVGSAKGWWNVELDIG